MAKATKKTAATKKRAPKPPAAEAVAPPEPDHFDGKLTDEQKTFVVQALACFETPSQICAALKDLHDVDIARQSIERYNPERAAGADLAQRWRLLFEETRKQMLATAAEIGIAHKSVRLKRLETMWRKAYDAGNMVLAAQLLEQAAKEEGGQYTNTRQHKLPIDPASGEEGGNGDHFGGFEVRLVPAKAGRRADA